LSTPTFRRGSAPGWRRPGEVSLNEAVQAVPTVQPPRSVQTVYDKRGKTRLTENRDDHHR